MTGVHNRLLRLCLRGWHHNSVCADKVTSILSNVMLCTRAATMRDWNPHRHSRLHTDFAETGQVQLNVEERSVGSNLPIRAHPLITKYERNCVCVCVCVRAGGGGHVVYCYCTYTKNA